MQGNDDSHAQVVPSNPDGRLQRVRALCREATERGRPGALVLAVAQHGKILLSEAWGTVHPLDGASHAATPDTVWLIASVTKPVVCAGVCLLLERGALLLDDPVSHFIPEFNGTDRAGVTLRHLLTHTSGLPDMLPENIQLRERHAPLSEFVRGTCSTKLLFKPGTGVSYQSMGIALLGAVIERIARMSCAEFLRREFFAPLQMARCVLGLPPELRPHTARVDLPDWQRPSDWDWNSTYWRELGAPWGGMHATASQFLRFMQMLLADGAWEGRSYFAPATLREMVRPQSSHLPHLSEAARREEVWGLGWRHQSGRKSEYYGDLVGWNAYGHGGATGTVVWNDPESGVSCVLFGNHPESMRFLGQVSNAVAAALHEPVLKPI